MGYILLGIALVLIAAYVIPRIAPGSTKWPCDKEDAIDKEDN